MQAPLKQQYRDDPRSAVVTLVADGELDGTGVACRVRTASALAEAGLHPATGGDGTQLCSGDMLLEALVACAGVTLRAVATSMGLDVERHRARRGRPGLPRHARRRQAGPGRVPRHPADLRPRPPTPTPTRSPRLIKLTERYCVVLQTLRPSPTTSVHVNTAGLQA